VRQAECPFQDILAWVTYAMLSDTDAFDTYRDVFHPEDVGFSTADMHEEMHVVMPGKLGIWSAVDAASRVVEAENLERAELGEDGATE